jgi:hypothetical protein
MAGSDGASIARRRKPERGSGARLSLKPHQQGDHWKEMGAEGRSEARVKEEI